MSLPRQLSMMPPVMCLLVLMGFSHFMPTHVVLDEAAQDRKKHIAATMEAVPFFIGPWIGKDEAVPPEAQKLLRPNAIFSRVYRKSSGPRVQVMVVHCSDARDMIGHYPPICYPSAGWVPSVNTGIDQLVEVDGIALPVRLYNFSRVREGGQEDQIRIFNAFILPDGNVTRDISDINRQSERLAVSVQGVAQLQVITSGNIEAAEAADVARELLTGMKDLFAALDVGAAGDVGKPQSALARSDS